MKFTVTFKTPDALRDAAKEEADSLADTRLCRGAEEPDRELFNEVSGEIENEMVEFAEKWIEFGEYVRIEFDLDLKTAKVLEV